jgi:AraC-like DNA-binding protein
MPVIAAMLDARAVMALRRTLPKGGPSVVTCKTAAALHRLLEKRLVDAVVLNPGAGLLPELVQLRARLPLVPLVAYAPFRPDDGALLLACRQAVSSVAVEGVDDPILGDLVARSSVTAERRRALADAPRMLRLTEPLQRAAWDVLIGEVERPIRTDALARRLRISREHLSRQFGAGGAPNLKRVIDLTRVACAAHLLGNPGYSVPTVVRVLHFTSPGHLAHTARRIANVPTSSLGDLGPRGVLSAFVRGNTRSRAGCLPSPAL